MEYNSAACQASIDADVAAIKSQSPVYYLYIDSLRDTLLPGENPRLTAVLVPKNDRQDTSYNEDFDAFYIVFLWAPLEPSSRCVHH